MSPNLVLDDDVVNIIYIDDQGDLRKSSTAPQVGLLIARAETSGGSISGQIEDLRPNVNMLVQPLVDNVGSIIPKSSIVVFGGAVAPNGWLFCDGTPYDPSTYPQLFSAIGYGFGQVGSLFRVPDMRDRSPVGAGISFDRGTFGGSATTSLSVDNMPAHSHNVIDPGHTHSMNHGPGQHSAVALDYHNAGNGVDAYVPQWGGHAHTIYASGVGISLENTGSGTPVSVRNPYVGFAEKVSPKFMPLLTKNFLTNQ
ncbi:phage tail protein [Crocosphaera watsonii WH 8501]|uniref:Phage Tail Collar n=1 Tax=Crocosphaera watsonii WH 8501 TaxID=165597 RepID=Q4C9U4_CROWT|nr:tail fiber protein [Crocosphaera watsonii]EAM53192.1 Phage Tail Collar [Crocosphaera watsonii WH 8501]